MHFPWHTTGHERQKKEIEGNILQNNISHAYLFSGPADVGKFYFAKEVAMALLCPNSMCRTCSACRQIRNNTHPDFLVLDMLYIDKEQTDWDEISKFSNISQTHRKNAETKTDTITIEDIKEIQRRIQERPLGKYKICLVKNVDRINIEATNAFLKSVEEPPKNTKFIFTTSKENSLLPTFVSRLRIIRFNLLHTNDIAKVIKDSPEKNNILEYAQGRISTAVELSQDPEKYSRLKKIYEEIETVYEKMDTAKRFAYAAKLAENLDGLKHFFEYSYFYLRSKITPDNSNLVSTIETLEKTEKLLKQNVNKKLALENFFLELDNK